MSCGWGRKTEDRAEQGGHPQVVGGPGTRTPKGSQRPERAGWGGDWRPATHAFIQPTSVHLLSASGMPHVARPQTQSCATLHSRGEGSRGRQRMSWLNGITASMDVGLSKLWDTVEDRGAWRAAGHGGHERVGHDLATEQQQIYAAKMTWSAGPSASCL